MEKNSLTQHLYSFLSIGILLLGFLVIMGWFLNIPILVQIHQSFAPMQFNTALGFVAIAIALIARTKNTPGLFLITLGSLTLLQYILNINIGIDELFINHYIITETSHPGRMAPNTALCFLLSGIYFLRIKHKDWVVLLTGVIGSLGFIAFLGYSLNITPAYGWGTLTRMALHTSTGFILTALCGSLAFSSPNKLKEYLPITTAAFFAISFILIAQATLPIAKSQVTVYLFLIFGLFQSALTYISLNNNICLNRKNLNLEEKLRSELKIHQRASIRLNESNQELEQFAYIASHDLQEPLRMISGFLTLLKEEYYETINDEAKEYIDISVDASKRMSDMVLGLLEFSRINKKENKFEKIYIKEPIQEAITNLKSQIKATDANICWPTDSNLKVYADRSQMSRLIQNILSNAIKYCKKNPEIDISVKETGAGQVKLSIKDNGIGIDKKHFKRIFDIFQKLHSNDEYQGTGIGLSICQKIVQRHNGKIWIKSEIGTGSTFHILFPIRSQNGGAKNESNKDNAG